LKKFAAGGGQLFDLEFLVDSKGRRIAAFGTAAGTVGMAVSLLCWGWAKQNESGLHPAITKFFPSYVELAKYVSETISPVLNKSSGDGKIRVLVIGAKGRVGGGSANFLSLLSPSIRQCVEVTAWDMAETVGKTGPFSEIMDNDIFVNAILLPPTAQTNAPKLVFVNDDLVAKTGAKRRLSVIADLSCDVANPRNPVPLSLYKKTTDFDHPTIRVVNRSVNTVPLDVIAIDHLPALVPYESSKEFADALLPYLFEFSADKKQRLAKRAKYGLMHWNYLKGTC